MDDESLTPDKMIQMLYGALNKNKLIDLDKEEDKQLLSVADQTIISLRSIIDQQSGVSIFRTLIGFSILEYFPAQIFV